MPRSDHPRTIDAPGSGPDLVTLSLVGALMTLGAVMVYSASVTLDGAQLDLRQWWNTPLRQSVFALLGFATMMVAARLDPRLFAWQARGPSGLSIAALAIAILLLLLVLLPGIGQERLGARRALQVLSRPFPLSFQPSEFAKLALILWLAMTLSRPPAASDGSPRRAFLPVALGPLALVGLTGLEDFGTAALMALVTLCMFVVGGVSWRHIAGTCALGVVAGVGLLLLKPYRLQRLLAHFAGERNESADHYQTTQALIAIASGGWWGRGLGAGVQKYGYLPQDNNDFIFAIVCEELGMLGGVAVICLFLALLARGWWIARRSDDFGRLLAIGVTLMVCLQAAFNILVVTRSVPTKGISLPFVSAGGSGVLFLGLAAGLLAGVAATHARAVTRRRDASGASGRWASSASVAQSASR